MQNTHKESIKRFLESHDTYRSYNGALVWDMYEKYFGHMLEGIPEDVKERIRVFIHESDKVISLEAITRAKRKLQEDNEELRGHNYGRRKRKARDIRSTIHTETYYTSL